VDAALDDRYQHILESLIRITHHPWRAGKMTTQQQILEAELAELVVQTLNLDMKPEEIDPATSLFEDLGLDSLDVLEIALTISKRYGVKLRSDDENNQQIFSSLSALANHIDQHRVVK
jgi:acyl carrier protein